MLTDTHAHLTSADVEAQLARALAAGVTRIINITTTPDELQKALALQLRYSWIDVAAATHPHDATEESYFSCFAHYARAGKLIAIGETGLDYHYHHSPKEVQQGSFVKYLTLASECQLPIIIHCREAFSDLFTLWDAHYQGAAVVHCFTGTMAEAQEVLKRGGYLSFSGIVTFKKSIDLQQIAAHIPLDRLLIETDAPFLAPHPMRGKENESAYIDLIARFIADLRGLSLIELAEITSNNATRLFPKKQI